MKYLLDTAPFLWALFEETEKLSSHAIDLIQEAKAPMYLSAASAWEIAIKYSLKRLPLKRPPDTWLPDVVTRMNITPLPIHIRHALAVTDLPWHHRDPFDRLLAAQAKTEGLTIVSPDPIFRRYRVPVAW